MLQKLEEMRKALQDLGLSEEEIQQQLKVRESNLRKEVIESDDVVSTANALIMVNTKLKEAGLIRMKKDEFNLNSFRQIIIKQDNPHGRLRPIDSNPPKVIGFHFTKETIEEFVQEEINYRKVTKEELYQEVQRLQKENEQLKSENEQPQKGREILFAKLEEIREENEQLKKQLEQSLQSLLPKAEKEVQETEVATEAPKKSLAKKKKEEELLELENFVEQLNGFEDGHRVFTFLYKKKLYQADFINDKLQPLHELVGEKEELVKISDYRHKNLEKSVLSKYEEVKGK